MITFPRDSQLSKMNREAAEIRLEFACAHLRQARHIESLELKARHDEEYGESLDILLDECIAIIKEPSLDTYRMLNDRHPELYASQAYVAEVETLLDNVTFIYQEYGDQEPW